MVEPGPDERFDADFRDAYRGDEPADAGIAERTLQRLRGAATEPRGLASWLAPRPILMSPALAVGAVAVALALAVLAGSRIGRVGAPAREPATMPALAQGVPVVLVLRAPGATRVNVAGDFNGWDAAATPLARAGSGDTWTVQLTVPRGVHLYSFVLDGREWTPDPSAPLAAEAAYGERNSVLVAGGSASL
jgi:hypothetical protein